MIVCSKIIMVTDHEHEDRKNSSRPTKASNAKELEKNTTGGNPLLVCF